VGLPPVATSQREKSGEGKGRGLGERPAASAAQAKFRGCPWARTGEPLVKVQAEKHRQEKGGFGNFEDLGVCGGLLTWNANEGIETLLSEISWV